MRIDTRLLGLLAALIAAVLLTGTPQAGATARPERAPAPRTPAAEKPPADPTSAKDETGLLQPGWRSSADQLWTLRGDASGLHLLAASARSAYSWRTVATLADPDQETDQWIGNACLTRSGRYAVVVYAPRTFVNRATTFLRGGAVAIVDMSSGRVRKVDVRGSLAYFNPGCGDGEDAILTQSRLPEESHLPTATRLIRINAVTGAIRSTTQKRGQYSSAVATRKGIVAAHGRSIVLVSSAGKERVLVRRAGAAFHLSAGAGGTITYLSGSKTGNRASRITLGPGARKPAVIARARGSWLDLDTGTGGRVFVIKPGARTQALGRSAWLVGGAVGDQVSTTGQAMLVQASTPSPKKEPQAWAKALTRPVDTDGREQVKLAARIVSNGKRLDFRITPGLRSSNGLASGLAPRRTQAATSDRTLARTTVSGPAEPSATCAVPRNDPGSQVLQPTPRQVEWAADQAVVNNLKTARPANWNQSGLSSWTPQTMFPSKSLTGGGRVPVQVLLGILANESNLWQASNHALPGEFGNPLVGNYYGRSGDSWTIDFANADCGYGVGQVTDGMRKSSTALTTAQKRAIALDYETNIARSLQILQDKWNQSKSAGLIHSNADPSALENWIFAVWAYNSGFYANAGNGSPWGVGYFNNPANPNYPANRGLFNDSPDDAKYPSRWPYEERVIGWAAFSIATPDGPGFQPAWWISEAERYAAQPPQYAFCDSSNACTPNTADPCPAWNSSCWWHKAATYHDCANGYCGHELLRFDTSYPEQPNGTNYPPDCTTNGLPLGSRVIDDVPASSPAATSGCGHPWTERGTFSLDFATASARIDFHQIGGGRGGHYWFAHTRDATRPEMEVTGTWTFSDPLNQWGRVLVHVPDHGADTQQAAYKIKLGDGRVKTRYLPQRIQENRWVSLGVVDFNGIPSISLSSQTWDGAGADDVAWDAVAIQPLTSKPADFVVALGDSYASGEGASDSDNGDDYYKDSDYGGDYDKVTLPDGSKVDDRRRNACHRSPYSWSRQATLADDSSHTIAERAGSWDTDMDYHLVACSGAESENLLPNLRVPAGETKPVNAENQGGQGQYHEVSQLDSGYLDENTTLVTLSIGGNDAQFGPIVKDCVMTLEGEVITDCRDKNSTGDGPNDEVVPGLITDTVSASVTTVVRQIHRYAPNAKILLMAYPILISDDGSCFGVGAIDPQETAWIGQMTLLMRDTLSGVVGDLSAESIPVVLGDPVDDFMGRGACGSDSAIHGIVWNHTSGDYHGDLPSQQSFHPNITGAFLYADAANRALRLLGE